MTPQIHTAAEQGHHQGCGPQGLSHSSIFPPTSILLVVKRNRDKLQSSPWDTGLGGGEMAAHISFCVLAVYPGSRQALEKKC